MLGGFLLAARASTEWASLLMASTMPLMPCLLISALDSSICSLFSCKFNSSLCLLSSLSSLAWIAPAMRLALLEIADPTSWFALLAAAALLVSSPLLLLLADEFDWPLVCESDYPTHILKSLIQYCIISKIITTYI